MVVELRKRDADIAASIIADYLDNIAAENTVTKSCELLLTKLGHYEKVQKYYKKSPHPTLEELLEGGVKSSVARRDIEAIHRFHKKLEIINTAFRTAHVRRGK
ncbi:MAG: hypothetical protein WA364_12075 [Candidatus Nitrosopolaris sp.]